MNAEQLIATALAKGYCAFSFDEIEHTSLKRSLRSMGRLTQTELHVRNSQDSRPNTYSAIFGVGSFPFHTDFAFRANPPPLIALCNHTDETFDRCTYVSDFANLSPELTVSLRKSEWQLQSNGKRYVVGGCIFTQSQFAFRWDLRALFPANHEATCCALSVPRTLAERQHVFRWRPRSGILINNWRVAHARAGETSDEHEVRTLVRYEVW
jgi:alpha-ketoglutarate-dependent taurine dioxygenase